MSVLAWKRGVTAGESAEIDACTNCPLPECYECRYWLCPLWDPSIVANEMRLEILAPLRRRGRW